MDTLRVSWSQLRTHEECRQKAYRIRQGKRATLEDQRVFFPGNVTDRVVRDWLKNDPTPGRMPEMVNDIMGGLQDELKEEGKPLKFKSRGDREQIRLDCIEAVTKIEPSLLKYVVPFEYQPDFRFTASMYMPDERQHIDRLVLLNGAMDILVKDKKGRFFIFDVKHTRDDSYYKKTAGQMLFYDLCVEVMFGQAAAATALLQPLCKERVKKIPTTADERRQILMRVNSMANDVWQENFAPRDDNTICNYCAVRHACSKFEPVIINGKKRVEF